MSSLNISTAVREAIVIQNRFRIDGKLNQGAFGVIYKGTDLQTEKRVAIKFESTFAQQPQLAYEFKLYTSLNSTNVISPSLTNVAFPKVYWFGVESSFYVLVMDLMGFSLEDLFQMCHKRFSLQTTLLLVDQMLSLIEQMHRHYYLYRDIKPDNFVIGLGEDQNILHLIDFGLAKRYRDPNTMQHLPYSENCPIVGTVRYVSKSTHASIEQSRRDDLESLGYTWIYFLKGSLPWQGLKVKGDKQRHELIFQSKLRNTPEILCKDLPIEFRVYFEYINKLSFYDKPDYTMLRNMFQTLYKKMKFDSLADEIVGDTAGNAIPVVYDWHRLLEHSSVFNADAIIDPEHPEYMVSLKKDFYRRRREAQDVVKDNTSPTKPENNADQSKPDTIQ